MSGFLKSGLEAIEKSGKVIFDYFEKIDTTYKKNQNNRDLVSEVDIISEQIILETLKKKFKSFNYLAEESGFENNHSNYTWVIDPLDGTVNYSRGLNLCAISIALTCKNKTILGIIYNPFLKELYYTTNRGAFLNGKKISVSQNLTLKNCLVIGALSSEISKNNIKQFAKLRILNNKSLGVLRIGSAAYALSLLARGSVDIFFGNSLKTWDVQAGAFLVKQAGGIVKKKMNGKDTLDLNAANCKSNFLKAFK